MCCRNNKTIFRITGNREMFALITQYSLEWLRIYSWTLNTLLNVLILNKTRCSAERSFIRPQRLNPERLGQVWTQHSSWIQLWIWIVIKKLTQHRFSDTEWMWSNELKIFVLPLSNSLCCWILILSKKCLKKFSFYLFMKSEMRKI